MITISVLVAMLGTRNISMSNIKQVRGLCPCAIQTKHNPNWKPTICGCMGPDKLYEECDGDYVEYTRMSTIRHNDNMAKMSAVIKSIHAVSWPSDSTLTQDAQRVFEKRLVELREDGLI